MLARLFQIYTPRSVLDVGCGRGAWLLVAERLGSEVLRGIDGPWVPSHGLLSPNIEFTAVDMDHDFDITGRFDLCISLEVAEHLHESRAGWLVQKLCGASDVVLFSAAIKDQGGTNHVNEQWQRYWIDLFQERGFECFDAIRGWAWRNEAIDWWYRQNAFVFVSRTHASFGTVEQELSKLSETIVDAVHPGNYEKKMKAVESYERAIKEPDLAFCLSVLRNYLRAKFI